MRTFPERVSSEGRRLSLRLNGTFEGKAHMLKRSEENPCSAYLPLSSHSPGCMNILEDVASILCGI